MDDRSLRSDMRPQPTQDVAKAPEGKKFNLAMLIFAAIAQVGRYQTQVAEARRRGSFDVRFMPFVPRTSQKKRRQQARRA